MRSNFPMDYAGRSVLFHALVGSHNYNLNTSQSDEDYKAFVLPTFYDLYDGKRYSSSSVTDDLDVEVHDIRHLGHLLFKSNVNFMEVLFSKNIVVAHPKYEIFVRELLEMREELAVMNLPYLWNACIGMHYNKMKQLNKGTAGTQELVDAYGYDTKQATHAYRIIDFLERFADNDFTSFEDAMIYTNVEANNLLDFKLGIYSEGQFRESMDKKLAHVKEKCEEKYQSNRLQTDTLEKLNSLVRNQVRREIVLEEVTL